MEIGDDVWIGGGAVICPGVVTRDIPRDLFAAGNPCRVVRDIGTDTEAH